MSNALKSPVSEAGLVDQGGRPLGPRAQQTRQRILDATVELLNEKSMRDLRVIDIARRIGSSPATFYQYFKDVEDVVLCLAEEVSLRTPEMVELIRGDWTGRAGWERGRQLANLVIDHWDAYRPILRVRNNASDEGDERFRAVRVKAMMPIVNAFVEEIVASHRRAQGEPEPRTPMADDWEGGNLDPTTAATALASMLQRLSLYHEEVAAIGTTREHIVDTAATLLQFVLTSRG